MIVREEEERVRLNPVFNGIEISQDHFIKFESLRVAELTEGFGTEEVLGN
jgi:hypothetical protein